MLRLLVQVNVLWLAGAIAGAASALDGAGCRRAIRGLQRVGRDRCTTAAPAHGVGNTASIAGAGGVLLTHCANAHSCGAMNTLLTKDTVQITALPV